MPGHYDSSQSLLEAAVHALDAKGLTVVRKSKWRQTAAWPNPEDPGFVNGVVIVESQLYPLELLYRLHAIERAFGRERRAPNAARTLDLDLIAFGRTISNEPLLPHPRAHQRRFVMGPLAEIAPDWVHPTLGQTAAELAATAKIG